MVKVKLPIYNYNILVWYGINKDIFLRYTSKHNIDPGDMECDGVTVIADKHTILVWTETKNVSILAHELLHAIFMIYHELGIRVNLEDSGEQTCYLLDYAMRHILASKSKKRK